MDENCSYVTYNIDLSTNVEKYPLYCHVQSLYPHTHSHTHTLFPVTQSDLSSLVFTVPCTQLYKYILLKQKRKKFCNRQDLTTDAKNLDAGSNRRRFF